MYFNARKWYKDRLKDEYSVDEINHYMKSWVIKCHGLKVENGIMGREFSSDKDWETKTKPTPLSEKEIKKFRGEL